MAEISALLAPTRFGRECGGAVVVFTGDPYRTEDLAPGENIIFAAAGVTEGPLLEAVRFFRDGTRTECLVMTTNPRQVRFIDTIHAEDRPDLLIRF